MSPILYQSVLWLWDQEADSTGGAPGAAGPVRGTATGDTARALGTATAAEEADLGVRDPAHWYLQWQEGFDCRNLIPDTYQLCLKKLLVTL